MLHLSLLEVSPNALPRLLEVSPNAPPELTESFNSCTTLQTAV